MWIKKPYITIITPTYNRADLLESAILSVINQKHDIPFDWELIIVDDGSTDNTQQLVEKYINEYPKNIQYYYQKNSWIPGVARNTWLDYMNKKSDYVIFHDSDDELTSDCIWYSLKKFLEKEKQWDSDKFLGMYFLCKDENSTIIWNKSILLWKKERKFTYDSFLKGEINVEMWLITKSSIFLKNPKLRFDNEVITEWVMRSKMWQYMDTHDMYISVFDYVGRLYRVFHNSEIQITKTISPKRFKNNALWNEKILTIIWNDLLVKWYKKTYWDFLFRIWINWFLFGNTKQWKTFLLKALRYQLSLRNIAIYLLSNISKKLILKLYKIYIT